MHAQPTIQRLVKRTVHGSGRRSTVPRRRPSRSSSSRDRELPPCHDDACPAASSCRPARQRPLRRRRRRQPRTACRRRRRPSATRTWCAGRASSPARPSRRHLAPLPEPLNRLDFDAYRDIRFRPDRALLGGGRRPVPDAAVPPRVPLPAPGDRERHPRRRADARCPTSAQLFDYGRNKIERPLPVNLGFAGFRLHYPLNDPQGVRRAHRVPRRELFPLPRPRPAIRPLGARPRHQCAKAASPRSSRISANSGSRCRQPDADRAIVYALLDGPSVSGRLPLRDLPGARDDARRHGDAVSAPGHRLGRARAADLDVSSRARTTASASTISGPSCTIRTACLMHTGAGEWIWRPLRNPARKMDLGLPRQQSARLRPDAARPHLRELSGPRGLLSPAARATGSSRPATGARAASSWSRFRPTNETHDNIVAYWQPQPPLRARPGDRLRLPHARRRRRPTTCIPGGKVVNTFQAPRARERLDRARRSDRRAAS